ncbi:phage replisome organizer N-terminal domain-containing protein [Clostridium sp. CH2]|uniref:phage replisome organizer N-terminal domain-containing protein n=1 Tax=Clostridium sp. CH2 TaxID=2949990 RepID=UPI00207956FD|nr:phage replisome organizer N-terminal domain-containing protein [Clostridium sp. CH2]
MERKVIKLKVDMYNDTKFKIIDTMEERDLIHYIWTRLLTLAGRVNLEGELYLSKSIPYTIETLALEFNRSAKKVALALKVFMDLEMVELSKNNVYKVRNFAKHQNIKSKKKEHHIDKLETVDNIEGVVDKSSDIDGIVNRELMENTHDIGNVIHADKTALHKRNDINTTEVLESKIAVVNEDENKIVLNKDKECITENKFNNKTRSKPKTKKKKTNDCDIVSTWEDEANNIEICEFTGEVPKGKVIRTFFIPEV